MESWVPLFDIFLKSPSPESEASLWLQRSFGASTAAVTTIPTTAASFVSLLMKPMDAIVVDVEGPSSSSSSPISTVRRVMYLQTLPNMVQARILSFLAVERRRFCRRDLCRLARSALSSGESLDFWVEKAARNLFDILSESTYEWISCLGLDSGEEERPVDDFETLPGWLNDDRGTRDLLPWLPMSHEDLTSSRMMFGDNGKNMDGFCEDRDRDRVEESIEEVSNGIEVETSRQTNDPLGPGVLEEAASLKSRVMNVESTSKSINVAREISKLCRDNQRGDSLTLLGLIEPWLVEDEIASILVSQLSNESEEEEPVWPSQVLCSIVLPKLLVLEEPASRVLLAATINFCKLHQKAAEYGLLVPLILRENGINSPICDVITKIIKECLHIAHVSAVCQKLLGEAKDERRFVCLPCHRGLVSEELVWTESLFNLFQNILNHNVCLTQDSVDHIVRRVQHLAERFSKSLKFGNFLLCFVTKCSSHLKFHNLTLTEAVKKTNTLVTKSTLSKLASL